MFENVIDSTLPLTLTHIPNKSFAINESCVIKSNSDYRNDPIEHHSKDAIKLNREIKLSLRCGRNIDTSLTSIDIAMRPNLWVVSKESPHPLKERDVRHKLKRNVTRKLLNLRRPTTVGWRLNDKEFDELNRTYSFTLEGCRDPLGLNGHHNLPFYSEQNSLLDHDVSGQSIYCNPPWALAIKCVEHLRAYCHSKSPLDTKEVIVLSDLPTF